MLVSSTISSGVLTWGIPLLVFVLVMVYWAVVVARRGGQL